MSEKLHAIDTSAIEKLAKIKEEQDRLISYQRKAEEIKDTVDDTIYRRVRADYANRNSAFEQDAKPLKDEARKEYEKLCSIYDQLKQALDKALGVKQELEFRHAVEEFDKTTLAEKLKEPERIIEHCRAQIGDADQLRAKFIAAFHSEEDLKLESELQSKDVAASQSGLDSGDDFKLAAENEPEPVAKVEAKANPKDKAEDPSNTQFEPLELGTKQSAAESQDNKTSVRETPAEAEGTSVETQGKLVSVSQGEPSEKYILGVLNYIGRADDNHIRLMSPTVSRKHALVTKSTTKFTLKDLDSRSGTFVNDEKITECALTDGDRIQLGEVELIFRTE